MAVGTWALGLHVFALPGLRPVTSEAVGGEVIPRRCAPAADGLQGSRSNTACFVCRGLECACLWCKQ